MKLSDISVGKKLSYSFLIIIVLSIAIIGATLNTFFFGIRFAGETSFSRNVDSFKHIARVHEKTFALTSSEASMKEMNKALDESEKNLQTVMASKDEFALLQMDKLTLIKQYLADYRASFANLVDIENRKKTAYISIESNRNSLVSGLSTGLKDTTVIKTQKHLLEIINSDNQSIRNADKHIAYNLDQGSSNELRNLFIQNWPELEQTLQSYSASVSEYINLCEDQEKLSAKMDATSQKISEVNTDFLNTGVIKLKETIFSTITIILVFLLLTIIIAIVLSIVITKQISGGVKDGVAVAESIAKGSVKVNVKKENLFRKDEIGTLCNSLQSMATNLAEIIEGITDGAEKIKMAGEELSDAAQTVSDGASHQASTSEEIASSMDEILSSINRNTNGSKETETAIGKAFEGVKSGSEAAAKAADYMNRVMEKINVVTDIAFQTNILALNAAVEAARAGEHGKGFAVVASEVRKLAEKSREAADEIILLSRDGNEVVEMANEKLASVLPDISKTVSLIQEIAAAGNEQSAVATQVNNALRQLNDVVQENAATSEAMASNTIQLSEQVDKMYKLVSFFKG